jgi:hypothetical protein
MITDFVDSCSNKFTVSRERRKATAIDRQAYEGILLRRTGPKDIARLHRWTFGSVPVKPSGDTIQI